MGLLQASRGRSMEKGKVHSGIKSSSVEARSPVSWPVTPQTQLETPAHLVMLLDSPAQVLEEAVCLSKMNAVFCQDAESEDLTVSCLSRS